MKKVTTVCGDITPEALGLTSMHEHLLYDTSIAAVRVKKNIPPEMLPPAEKLTVEPKNFKFLLDCNNFFNEETLIGNDVDIAAFEVNEFKKLGGKSVLDAGSIDIRGDVLKYKELSEKTGINIICSTGLYQNCTWPEEFFEKSEKELAEMIVTEVECGIGDTGIKPGAIKSALGIGPALPGFNVGTDIANLKACARAVNETGLLLHIHCAHTGPGVEYCKKAVDILLDEYSVKPDRVLMCHQDTWTVGTMTTADYVTKSGLRKDINSDLQLYFLDRGVNIGFDTWGCEWIPPTLIFPDDNDRLKLLIELINKGYTNQIVFGNDMTSYRIAGVAVGGYGMTRFASFTIPMLDQLGFEKQAKIISEVNPARLLAHD